MKAVLLSNCKISFGEKPSYPQNKIRCIKFPFPPWFAYQLFYSSLGLLVLLPTYPVPGHRRSQSAGPQQRTLASTFTLEKLWRMWNMSSPSVSAAPAPPALEMHWRQKPDMKEMQKPHKYFIRFLNQLQYQRTSNCNSLIITRQTALSENASR